jgi:hypothetical protein
VAPRRRSAENQWLEAYPGLHVFPDGRFYVVHPVTGNKASLGTRDKKTALALYGRLAAKWQPEKVEAVASALLEKLDGLDKPRSPDDDITFAEYAKRWREGLLGVKFAADGRVKLSPTKIVKKGGKPISEQTQRDYGKQCRQLEESEAAGFKLSDDNLLNKTRRLLAPWAEQPTHYNHLIAVVSHVYRAAIREGIANIDRNPATDIEKMAVAKRKVYIPDADYIAITCALMQHEHMGKIEDGEWRARICDLLYMVSSRPGDYFKLKDSNLRLDLGEHGEIHFGHSKTEVDQIIEMDAEMRELVEWFLAFKRQHRIFNRHLLCYPPYMGRMAGKPVSHRQMWQYFHDAVIEAGFPKGKYRLQDLRKKALTDEFINQGENDKGGHQTEAARKHYRLMTPPKRAKNTLANIRKAGGTKGA